jgi:hypothetical protein
MLLVTEKEQPHLTLSFEDIRGGNKVLIYTPLRNARVGSEITKLLPYEEGKVVFC